MRVCAVSWMHSAQLMRAHNASQQEPIALAAAQGETGM